MEKTAKFQIWFFKLQTGKTTEKNQWNEGMPLRRTALHGCGGKGRRREEGRPHAGQRQLEADPSPAPWKTDVFTACDVVCVPHTDHDKNTNEDKNEQNWNP